jgi:hypothetical protein
LRFDPRIRGTLHEAGKSTLRATNDMSDLLNWLDARLLGRG